MGGVREAGDSRKARAGRIREGEFFNFCVDHVRHYNKSFNYFSGLNDTEIAKFQKEAITGHRPTWKAASTPPPKTALKPRRAGAAPIRAPKCAIRSGLFNDGKAPVSEQQRKLKQLEAKSLDTLGLPANAKGETIKARYKELVKQHHPDANGGDRSSEDRLAEVIRPINCCGRRG